MLCLRGFELYFSWVPASVSIKRFRAVFDNINYKIRGDQFAASRKLQQEAKGNSNSLLSMTAGCPIIMLWEIFICIKAFNDFLGFHNSDQRKYLRQRGDPSIELGLTPNKSSCTRKIKSEAITAVTALFAGFLLGSKPVWLVISQ